MSVMKKLKYILPAFVLLFMTQSCDDMLVFPDDEQLLAEDALNTPDDLQRLLNSCYDVFANTYNGRTQVIAELLSDNLQEPPNNNNLSAGMETGAPISSTVLPMACILNSIEPFIESTHSLRVLMTLKDLQLQKDKELKLKESSCVP